MNTDDPEFRRKMDLILEERCWQKFGAGQVARREKSGSLRSQLPLSTVLVRRLWREGFPIMAERFSQIMDVLECTGLRNE